MAVLLALILCFFAIILVGKTVKNVVQGYLLVTIITVIQVAIILLYMYTMEVPTP